MIVAVIPKNTKKSGGGGGEGGGVGSSSLSHKIPPRNAGNSTNKEPKIKTKTKLTLFNKNLSCEI